MDGGDWLGVLPAPDHITPASVLIGITPPAVAGSYSGWITITAEGATNSPVNVRVSLILSGTATRPPMVRAVVNAASFAEGSVAPGEIVTIFGSAFGPATGGSMSVSAGVVATTLAGTRVFFDELPAPLIYASDKQVSAIVPYGLAPLSTAQLRVETPGARSANFSIPVTRTAPGVFVTTAGGTGNGAILNQDLSLNAPSNPAPRGGVVFLYATGEGATTPPGSDGLIENGNLRRPVQNVSVIIGGLPAEVLYAGSAPGLVLGILQVNARIPAGIRGSEASVVLTVGQAKSQPGVTVAVKQ